MGMLDLELSGYAIVQCRVEYHLFLEKLDSEGKNVTTTTFMEKYPEKKTAENVAKNAGYVRKRDSVTVWENREDFSRIRITKELVEIPEEECN